MRKSSAQLTSATAFFTPDDVEKPIYVPGAGVQKFPDLGELPEAPLSRRIAAPQYRFASMRYPQNWIKLLIPRSNLLNW
jgi:hypothetical protein